MQVERPNRRRTALASLVVCAELPVIIICSCESARVVRASGQSAQKTSTSLTNPDAACANCHRAIYQSYERTPMAQDSGDAVSGLIPGDFLHAESGVRYRIFLRDGKAWMSYNRDSEQAPLDGERQLLYFIGSGHRGRTYLYQVDGEWFELPINYYSKKRLWDMAPNYGHATAMPDAMPVDSDCLHCHATNVQQALPGARNLYAGSPFCKAESAVRPATAIRRDTWRPVAARQF